MTQQSTANSHAVVSAVDALIGEIGPGSIVSRAVFGDADTKVILFGFAPDQELSEHTAPRPAILHFLRGGATLTLGSETIKAGPGTMAHMPPNLPHSIHAHSEVLMLLIMLPRGDPDQS